jgi:thiamine pyridinylase
MIDVAGSTTDAALYLDMAHSLTGLYPLPLPGSPSDLNRDAIANMRALVAMASYRNGTAEESDDAYPRATWFTKGWGRAFVGFTESMSAMSEETRNNIGFKVMPLSDASTNALFYADVIGVNPATRKRGTRNLAVDLANVMAASATMIASIGPDAGKAPQYLMATRPSVFESLGKSSPLYNDMFALIGKNNPVMFRLGPQSRSWLKSMKGTIRAEALRDNPCGCDFPAAQWIAGESAAASICEATCANNGGWDGQWTNQPPPASGKSFCGCVSCPTY